MVSWNAEYVNLIHEPGGNIDLTLELFITKLHQLIVV